MKSNKYTPGPWHTWPGTIGDSHVIWAPDNIAPIAKDVYFEANAKLIAAAPELLEACLRALGYIGTLDSEHSGNVVDALSNAIDKARGAK